MTDTVLAFVEMGQQAKPACACANHLGAGKDIDASEQNAAWGGGGGHNLALLVMSMMRGCVRGLTWSVKHSFTVLGL